MCVFSVCVCLCETASAGLCWLGEGTSLALKDIFELVMGQTQSTLTQRDDVHYDTTPTLFMLCCSVQGQSVRPPVWSRLKCPNNCWMDCAEMWFRRSCSPRMSCNNTADPLTTIINSTFLYIQYFVHGQISAKLMTFLSAPALCCSYCWM